MFGRSKNGEVSLETILGWLEEIKKCADSRPSLYGEVRENSQQCNQLVCTYIKSPMVREIILAVSDGRVKLEDESLMLKLEQNIENGIVCPFQFRTLEHFPNGSFLGRDGLYPCFRDLSEARKKD